MERAIGEIFEFEGKRFKVVESDFNCNNCHFDVVDKICSATDTSFGECASYYREDEKNVIFKLLEE